MVGTDPVSGIPYPLLSLAVRYFFPDNNYSLQFATASTKSDRFMRSESNVPSGSMYEGLNLPSLIDCVNGKSIPLSDHDQMESFDLFPPMPYLVENYEQHTSLRPGYCYLYMPGSVEITFPYTELVLHSRDGKWYIKNDIQYLKFRHHMQLLLKEMDQSYPGSQHRRKHNLISPAFSFTTWLLPETLIGSTDVVPCIAIAWPDDAVEWYNRKRTFGWPKPSVIKSIVTEGCHLISKSHPLSSCPGIEWRYSFSVAEVSLCQTMNPMQKISYKVFKALIKCHKNTRDLSIPSYYLKTAFLWLCEESPVSSWNLNNLGIKTLCLLDRLLGYLRKRKLPQYFIPQNNQIEHLKSEVVEEWISGIVYIRKHPVQCMEEFHLDYATRDRICDIDIPFMSITYDFLRTIGSNAFICIDDFLFFTHNVLELFVIYYASKCYHGMMLSIAKTILIKSIVSESLNEVTLAEKPTGYKEDLKLLMDQYLFYVNAEVPHVHIGSILTDLPPNEREHFSAILSAELACICYQMSENELDSNKKKFRTRADKYFLKSLKDKNCFTLIKYAQYLVVQERYAEAVPLLQQVVRSREFYADHVSYSKYTCKCVEPTLRIIHSIEDAEIIYDVAPLAYYLLIICCKELEKDLGECGVPTVEEYIGLMPASNDNALRARLLFFEACFLLRYARVQKALSVLLPIPGFWMAAYFIWFGIAKLFCTYCSSLQLETFTDYSEDSS